MQYNFNGLPPRALGRLMDPSSELADSTGGVTVNDVDAPVFAPYEVVSSNPASLNDEVVTLDSTNTLPQPVQTMSPNVDCLDCTTPTSGAVATTTPTSVAATTVTPLPAAPKTTNWLLIMACVAVGYAVVKSHSPALNGPDEQPSPQELGRPPRPRKPAAKKARHVAHLTVS